MKRSLPSLLSVLTQEGRLGSSRVRPGSQVHAILNDAVSNGSVRCEFRGSRMAYVLVDAERLDRTLKVYFPALSGAEGMKALKRGAASRSRRDSVLETGDSKVGSHREVISGFSLFSRGCYSLRFPFGDVEVRPELGLHIRQGCFPLLPDGAVVFVVENAEPFYESDWIERIGYGDREAYVCCRYPSSKVLKEWLISLQKSVEIIYVGDPDLSGIKKYETEFKRRLGDRISFWVPVDVETLIRTRGNHNNYSRQSASVDRWCKSEECRGLLELIHKYHSGLEQELY